MIKNPYHPGRAIENVEDFYDRDEEVKRVFSYLNNMECISIVGERRIGKTSLLNYISSPYTIRMYGLDPSKYLFVFLYFGDFINVTQKEFLLSIIEKIEDKINDNDLKLKIEAFKKGKIDFSSTNRLIGEITKKFKIVLLCDEFGYTVKNKNFNCEFFTGLRGLASHNLSYIISTLDSLAKIIPKDIQGSGILTIFPNVINLKPFSYEDAYELVTKQSSKCGIEFSKKDIEFILDLSGYHPCFIQMACFEVFESKKGKKVLSDGDYEKIKKIFSINTEKIFEIFWNRSSKEEKEILRNLVNGRNIDNFSDVDKEHLEQRSLIFKKNGDYKIFSNSFREFVKKKISDKPKISIFQLIIGEIKILIRIIKANSVPLILFIIGTIILLLIYVFGVHIVEPYIGCFMYILGLLYYAYEWFKKPNKSKKS